MADTVVNFLMENLLQLVTENVNLIGGAKGELENLLEDVRSLKAFLEDAARQGSNSSSWKDFVKRIRIQVHKAEDVIDKFVIVAKRREEKHLAKKVLDFGHVNKVRNLAKVIKDIREKVKDIRRDNQLAFHPKPYLDLPKTVAREPQDNFLEVKQIVGFDDKAKDVIRRLFEKSEDLEFVPIVGMTGIGKTTLARKVWSSSQITTEFSKKIWVSVGQSDELKHIFFVILKSATEHIQELRYNDVNKLAKKITDFVTEQDRYLIVLDDVWETELVEFFKKILPKNKKGHRTLLTTRLRDVASCASHRHPYDMKFLSPDDSFQLLEERVFEYGKCRDELVELGKSIASKCGGIPLALVVIARALKARPTVNDWRNIENKFLQYLVKENDPSTCWKIVEASYESLSSEMKACFLYCLAFPKGYDIPVQKLILLWIAEGLIISSPGNSFEETAKVYLVEFEERDLVTVAREITGAIKKVKCNEIFYEFYKMKVTDESVFQELRPTADQVLPQIKDPDISRRLHIESSALFDFISTRPNAEHVRSFLCFSTEDKQTELSSPDDIQLILRAFPLIRVLKIESINIPSSKYLNQLFHLRYISISGNFKELPKFFSKFWSLQSIIINTSTSEPTLNIEANIWNMSKLRHLQTNIPAKLPVPSTQKGKGSSSLQTLSKISPETCNKVFLGKAWKNLRKLSIQGRIEDSLKTNRDKFSTFEGFQTFEGFKCLENLKLMSDVPCTSDALQLPKALFRFLLNLKKLTLSNTMFDWRDATKLGQLEHLEVLKLNKDAFTGKSWKPEKGDFRELQVLSIQNADLQFWEASRYHFPKLRKLVLTCPKLCVPVELSQFQQ